MRHLYFLFLLTLLPGKHAFCDTIDYWTVYLNNKVVGKFNQNQKPELRLKIDDDDTLSVAYYFCGWKTKTTLVYYVAPNDSIIGWNDGDYYTDQSTRFVLSNPHDSLFWDNAYYGDGRVDIPCKELRPLLAGSQPVDLYFIDKTRGLKGFPEQLVFSLYLERSEVPVKNMKPPNNAYFSSDSDDVEGFSVEELKQLIEDYPAICIGFRLVQLPGDSEKLGRKRIAAFEKLLNENNVSRNHYTVSTEIKTRTNTEDPFTGGKARAALEGIVVSIDGPCQLAEPVKQ